MNAVPGIVPKGKSNIRVKHLMRSGGRHRMRGHEIRWQRRRLETGAGLHHLIAGDDLGR
jgi:hypothetical protein